MMTNLTLVNGHSSGQIAQKNGYQSNTVREVQARASTINQDPSAEERRRLRRLNQVLNQEQPPRGNMPRGTYLNIEV